MAKKKSPKESAQSKQFGQLPPQHDFFLNPYLTERFTRCPKCEDKTKQRKRPLLIGIKPAQCISINKTYRYCPRCDLLIAHKDQLDPLAEHICHQAYPDLVGNDYLVLGTIERKHWQAGTHSLSMDDVRKTLHDFKQHLEFIVEPARWVME